MISLVINEITKFIYKRKMVLIVILLIIFAGLSSYGQQFSYQRNIERTSSATGSTGYDWKAITGQELENLKKQVNNQFIPQAIRDSLKTQIQQLNYYLENNIDPITPTAAKFSVDFVEQGITLFIPLLIIILAADLVSGEFSKKTIKILLTRAVPRWKILLSKYIALLSMTTLLVFMIWLISTLVSFIFFGRWGFQEPVITGLSQAQGFFNLSLVGTIPRTEYTIMVYSLLWFVCIVIASITLLISTLVDNSASAIGIVMSTLIVGQLLQVFLSQWEFVKYIFVTNLNLPKYITGSYQLVGGMSLNFSIAVLSVWTIGSLVIAFLVFSRQDVLV